MAWLMIPATIGPILGPPVGGFIVTYLAWRWIFYINVPIGMLGIVLVTLFIEEMREPGPVSSTSAVCCCPASRWPASCSASSWPAAASGRRSSAAILLAVGAGRGGALLAARPAASAADAGFPADADPDVPAVGA